jgi:hypothetical protein
LGGTVLNFRWIVKLNLCALLVLSLANTVLAVTITVDGTDGGVFNDGICSISEAILSANTDTAYDSCTAGNGIDTIILSSNIVLSTAFGVNGNGSHGMPLITSQIVLEGMGFSIERESSLNCNLNRITDSGEFRLIEINLNGNLSLNNITLKNGCADGAGPLQTVPVGGAIRNDGVLSLENSTISNNSAFSSGGGIFNAKDIHSILNSTFSTNFALDGAGIYNFLNARINTILGSTFYGNRSLERGGGIYNKGLIGQIANCTFSGNFVDFTGGGIQNESGISAILYSTFSGNQAVKWGSAVSTTLDFPGTINMLADSLFHQNIDVQIPGLECHNGAGTIAGFNNLSDNPQSQCPGVLTLTTSTVGPLADNGGLTMTHAILFGSEAVNSGDNYQPFDQRGYQRITASDIGSFEAFVPVVTAPADFSIEATGPLTSPLDLGSASVTDTDETGLVAGPDISDFPVGTTTVTWSAADSQGFIGTDTQEVTVVDTTPPTITLTGDNPQYIQETDSYVELGATATDLVDDDAILTSAIVIDTSSLITTVPGTYQVSYQVTDSNNNVADSVTRTVVVTADIPAATHDSYVTNEDTVFNNTVSVLANDSDPDNDGLTVYTTGHSIMTGMGGAVFMFADGTFTYVPVPDVSGTDVLDYEITDGTSIVPSTLSIIVNPVNDAPAFTVMGDVDVTGLVNTEDDFIEVPGFVDNIVLGPPDEGGQSVDSIIVGSIDPHNILRGIDIDNEGLLRADFNVDNYGEVTSLVLLRDDGGNDNGGDDTSEIIEFKIIYDDLIFGNGFEIK